MSFYSPMALFFMAGTIPIIIMYLLKKQHEDMEISSNYLWEKAIRDIEASRPWQRLRKNLLLFLQLIIFILMVLSLARPFILTNSISQGDLIIVMDTSASMQTVHDKQSRFEASKEEVIQILENKNPETKITLITMDTNPTIVASSIKDKSQLKSKLNIIEPINSSDNIDETMSLVNAILKENESTEVIIFTDKNIDFSLDNMTVRNLALEGDNLAIENIGHTVSEGQLSILTTVANFSPSIMKTDLILYVDEEIFDIKEVEVKPWSSENIYWSNISQNVNIVKAELDIDDALTVDNVRYEVINDRPISKVLLVSTGNVFLEKALSLSPNLELYKTTDTIEDLEGYNLYVFDGMLPQELPSDGNIIIFNPSASQDFNITGSKESGEIRAMDDDIFRYVDMDFNIAEVKTLQSPPWALSVLTVDNETVIVKGEKNKQKFVVIGFDLHKTDLPLRTDFPIFVQNLLEYSLNMNNQQNASILAGESINIDTYPTATDINIIDPQGKRINIAPPFPIAPYTETNRIGVYTIEQQIENGAFESHFVSNIDTIKESNTSVESKEDNNIHTREDNAVRTGKDIGPYLLLLALAFVMIEWVVYNRGY